MLLLVVLALTWFNILFDVFSVSFKYVVKFCGFVALQLCGNFDVTSYQIVYEEYVPLQMGYLILPPKCNVNNKIIAKCF